MQKFSYELREELSRQLTPSKRAMIPNYVRETFGYPLGEKVLNPSSLEGLLIYLLERATKHQRQDFLEKFDIRTIKVCDQCGEMIMQGYLVYEWRHYCSLKCLHEILSDEEIQTAEEKDECYLTVFGDIPKWAF